MILNGNSLTNFQSCKRRHVLELKRRVKRHNPKGLFVSCLRDAYFGLANGADPYALISTARTRYMESAARPGLAIVEGDPWTIASDYCAMLDTIVEAMSRLCLLTLRKLQPVQLAEDTSWQPLSWIDEAGQLQRLAVTDHYDGDFISRAMHSWTVFGDMSVCDAPMNIFTVEIGSARKGRRISPWARCYKHPVIYGMFKFQRPDGKGSFTALRGAQWKPLWYADQPKTDRKLWVDIMAKEGLTTGLFHSLAIGQPSEASARQAIDQILELREEMRSVEPKRQEPMSVPMSRGACDLYAPCPWQEACHRERSSEGIDELGLYQIRQASSSSLDSVRESEAYLSNE